MVKLISIHPVRSAGEQHEAYGPLWCLYRDWTKWDLAPKLMQLNMQVLSGMRQVITSPIPLRVSHLFD